MSAPRPHETDPFRTRISIVSEIQPHIYIYEKVVIVSSMWYPLGFKHAHVLKLI